MIYRMQIGQIDNVISFDFSWSGKDECLPLVDYVPEWLQHGARWVGGCCRTTADDIAKLRTVINSHVQATSV